MNYRITAHATQLSMEPPFATGNTIVSGGLSGEARRVRSEKKRGQRNNRRREQGTAQANNFIRREAKSRKPRRHFIPDDEMAPAGAGTAPEARPMEASP